MAEDHPFVQRFIDAAQNICAYTEAERSDLLREAAGFHGVVRIYFSLKPVDPDDPKAFDIRAMLRAASQEPARFTDEEIAVLLAQAAVLFQFAVPRMPEYFEYPEDEEGEPGALH